ncbi:hypothetical protein [Nitrospirillum pindoramense]|uniref:Type IV pilus biogenesis protein PilP n=1 Tax=Nitrospirillum amazonense TaxID=28077 RepID=A0A560HAT9_9PROT|nr:hypothetical protein [Nitrospirillum amazonense]TWB43231.1 hypothetical protein FBZ90_10544 [Nitrospirillum amazonense]
MRPAHSTAPLAAAFLALTLALPAHAAVPSAAGDVVGCKKIADRDQRLACFDKSSDELETELRKAVEATFGGSAAGKSDQTEATFGKHEPPPPPVAAELDNIKSRIVSVRPDPAGRPIFVLENGQVWRSQESARLHLKGDEIATVSHSMLGMGYELQVSDMSYSLSVVRDR